MIAPRDQSVQRIVLDGVPWTSYEAIGRALQERHIRVTYDRGRLEIMTLGHRHEFSKTLIGRLIEMLTFVLHIAIHSGGSTTFKRQMLERGLELDECYWIANEALMRGRVEYDIDADPPPDLAVEIDITSSSIDRMGIYAALRVPEVWRLDADGLTVHILAGNGKYHVREQSRAFPFLPVEQMRRFLREAETVGETALMHAFHDWVRDHLGPLDGATAAKKTKGRKSRKRG